MTPARQALLDEIRAKALSDEGISDSEMSEFQARKQMLMDIAEKEGGAEAIRAAMRDRKPKPVRKREAEPTIRAAMRDRKPKPVRKREAEPTIRRESGDTDLSVSNTPSGGVGALLQALVSRGELPPSPMAVPMVGGPRIGGGAAPMPQAPMAPPQAPMAPPQAPMAPPQQGGGIADFLRALFASRMSDQPQEPMVGGPRMGGGAAPMPRRPLY